MTLFRKYLFLGAVLLLAILCTECSDEKEPGTPGILTSTQWLQDHMNDPDVVLLHSGTKSSFDSLHIPGARYINPADFTVNTSDNRNEIPPADSILELLRRVGVENNSRIILYYENSRLLSRTARVFFTLDQVGLGEQTFVLDGGLPAWKEEGRETTDVSAAYSYGKLALSQAREVRISAEELERERWSPDVLVFDTRSDEEYAGTPGTAGLPAEGGHIEGAYFLPYQSILQEDHEHLFKPEAELKELFREAGMDPDKVNIVYCGSGIRASVAYLAARHLNYPVRLYDGSYEEWEKLKLPLTGPVAIALEEE